MNERNYDEYKVKYYTCKRMRLLVFLRERGLYPYMTVPDLDNPRYNVWRFEKSEALDEALDEYFAQFKK